MQPTAGTATDLSSRTEELEKLEQLSGRWSQAGQRFIPYMQFEGFFGRSAKAAGAAGEAAMGTAAVTWLFCSGSHVMLAGTDSSADARWLTELTCERVHLVESW